MRRLAAGLAVAASALSLPGCCALFCRSEPVKSPPRLSRDAPRDSVRFLADAIRRGAKTEIYDTLHPAFRQASGDYSLADFSAGFDYYESEFKQDADRLGSARLDDVGPLDIDGDGEIAPAEKRVRWVKVSEGGATATIGFVNAPSARIVLDDDFFPELTARMPRIDRTVEVQGDDLVVVAPIPLGGAAVDPSKVRRVEIFDNWLLFDIRETSGIRIAEIMKNQAGALQSRRPGP